MSIRLRRTAILDRGLGLTMMVGLALVFIIGVVFAVAYGSQQITRSATDLHKADESLRAATVVRAQVALTVFMSTVDDRFGTVSTDAQALSRSEVVEALGDLETSIEELQQDGVAAGTELVETAAIFTAVTKRTLQLLEEKEWTAAQEFVNDELNFSFRAFVDEATAVRNTLAAEVEASDNMLGSVSTVARFLVAFLIPVAVILTYRELSRRQNHEVELERRLALERELATSRDEFIANASHELRTPLTGITGMVMLLDEDPDLTKSELAQELIDVIIAESTDLERMVDDLLTTARLDAGALQFSFEDVDLRVQVNDVAASLTRTGMSIAVDCSPAIVRADRLRIRQVVRNLLSNARKYGGPDVHIEGQVEGRTYLLVISDDGEGLPSEIAQSAFQRFVHQGHDTAPTDSVGLGLSIVKSLANGMGGSVKYEREGGRTRFLVRLPLSEHSIDNGHVDESQNGHSTAITVGAARTAGLPRG